MIRRLGQVWHFLWSRPGAEDFRSAARALSPGELALFATLSAQDQAHGARVAARLEMAGAPRHVLAAAYLHDAGKPAGFGLFWRSLAVLWPGERPDPVPPARHPWSRARQIYHWHADYAASALESAGSSPDLTGLIRGTSASPWLEAFRRADDRG